MTQQPVGSGYLSLFYRLADFCRTDRKIINYLLFNLYHLIAQ